MAARVFVFVFGAFSYGAFLLAFLYLIGFVGNMVVPKSVDSGGIVPVWQAVLVNLVLVALFGVQHSVMARPAFKSWSGRFTPKPIERSVFVLSTSLVLAILYWQWRPVPVVVWDLREPWLVVPANVLFFLGWFMALYSSFIIDHFDLFGLRQVCIRLRNEPYRHPPFVVKSFYRFIRHPLMAGILIGIWSTPTMTLGHLLFSGLMTAYILVGVTFEERDLARQLGSEYRTYRLQTPMLIPWGGSRRSWDPSGGA